MVNGHLYLRMCQSLTTSASLESVIIGKCLEFMKCLLWVDFSPSNLTPWALLTKGAAAMQAPTSLKTV